MRRVFLDTSALVAFFDANDGNYQRSRVFFRSLPKEKIRVIISDYVLDECITMVLSRAGHSAAVRAGEFLLSSRIVELVWLDEAVKMESWEYFRKHADKVYSFTDCTSFVLMKKMKVNEYFGFDDDFKKAGFLLHA
ncbi:MAG: hypothetical protein A2X56_13630 [Nitrospirae bacterium GWC2_57_13]|jgi:uncharacterized protein|nr:MAG: hypothetical protein A2X56_13630 [Nitrospirae bacterium GWC2_57_13]HAR46526.1 nucleic acid-binding protein [Nitrospiraceae bacterium]HAS53675.1 nucleic acid-binding protein [Nitrospiraceae bacterium]